MVSLWRPAHERGDWELRDPSGAVVGRVRRIPQRGGTMQWQASTTTGFRSEELDSLAKAKVATEVMATWPPPIGDQRRPRPGRQRRIPNTEPEAAPHPGTQSRPPTDADPTDNASERPPARE